ncbi:GATC [Cordylochernes scorpioides]|uniref:Glutamyl-tRNA(Gln) amidotransferase subunit C, mitochondrial n=1 Tax=Cordylochernes scorpioides TaxID=51811 RepID=A0ABY6L7G6_9ARAC|nr:GATC [Cordylochernes scorpioides]
MMGSRVLQICTNSIRRLSNNATVDIKTVELLERLSLVDFANKAGVERLEEAIKFADKITEVDTTGVKPMLTVLEDTSLFLRDAKASEKNCRPELLKLATKTEENYYISPPPNIPLETDASVYFDGKSKK